MGLTFFSRGLGRGYYRVQVSTNRAVYLSVYMHVLLFSLWFQYMLLYR